MLYRNDYLDKSEVYLLPTSELSTISGKDESTIVIQSENDEQLGESIGLILTDKNYDNIVLLALRYHPVNIIVRKSSTVELHDLIVAGLVGTKVFIEI